MRFDQKVAIVTGGGTGIGRAAAVRRRSLSHLFPGKQRSIIFGWQRCGGGWRDAGSIVSDSLEVTTYK